MKKRSKFSSLFFLSRVCVYNSTNNDPKKTKEKHMLRVDNLILLIDLYNLTVNVQTVKKLVSIIIKYENRIIL